MEEIVLVGGGGHCKSVIDVILAQNHYSIKGIVDSSLPIGTKVLGFDVLGNDSILPKLVKDGFNFHITIGQISSNTVRKKLVSHLVELGANFPNIVSPFARVSPFASLGKGNTIMHGVTIQSDVQVGNYNIINDHSLLEHEVTVRDFCHIATGAIVNGNVSIENDVFIGSGAVIVQGTKINENSFIKANSLFK